MIEWTDRCTKTGEACTCKVWCPYNPPSVDEVRSKIIELETENAILKGKVRDFGLDREEVHVKFIQSSKGFWNKDIGWVENEKDATMYSLNEGDNQLPVGVDDAHWVETFVVIGKDK